MRGACTRRWHHPYNRLGQVPASQQQENRNDRSDRNESGNRPVKEEERAPCDVFLNVRNNFLISFSPWINTNGIYSSTCVLRLFFEMFHFALFNLAGDGNIHMFGWPLVPEYWDFVDLTYSFSRNLVGKKGFWVSTR